MTRNNLAEHLRWLLQARPSQTLPAIDYSHDGNVRQAQETSNPSLPHPQLDEDRFGDEFGDRELMFDQDEPSVQPQMSSPRRLVEVHATSPNVTARSKERQRSAKREMQTSHSAQMAVPQTPEGINHYENTIDDIEVLDMTDGHERMLSPGRFASRSGKQSIPRKRKSDDFEQIDALASERSTTRRQKTPATDQLSVTVKHDIPEGPPPPYSTVPPLNLQASRTAAQQLGSTGDRALTVGLEDDEDLFDFSNRRVKDRAREQSNTKQTLDLSHGLDNKHLSATVKTLPTATDTKNAMDKYPIPSHSTQTSTAKDASTEEVALLKQFFALPSKSMQHIGDDLAKRLDAVIDQIAYLHDEGNQDDEVSRREVELKSLTVVQDAVDALQKSAAKMQWLAAKRDEQFANLRKAIRQLDSTVTNQAKAANQAAKTELESFEKECLVQLRLCRNEVETAVNDAKQTTVTAQHVAIEASQFPQRAASHIGSTADSPARIMQTQAAVTRPRTMYKMPSEPGPTLLDDLSEIAQRPTTRYDTTTRSGPSLHAETSFHDFGIDDDFPMDDDDFCELEADMVNPAKFVKPAPPHRTALKETSVNVLPGSTSKGKTAKHDSSQLASLFNHPWSNDVKRILKEQFRLQGFRQGQLEAINATLAGQDAFVLMPTGGGKSLCYQLPSQIKSGQTQGVTVVVSPLLSLMEDQVQHLRKLNIQAFLLNGDTTQGERKHIWDTLARLDVGTFIQVLYITPEMLSKSNAMINSLDRLYSNKRFARLVIDEAHCVSQWGHDFRPDYKLIGEVRRKYPSVPVMALTATATENVKADTIHNLGIDGCKVFTRSFNRPNLYYEVREKGKSKDVLANMAALIKEKHSKQTGIIYCLSRKNCEDTAETLSKAHGIRATHYHAGMKAGDKSEVQRAWQEGKWHVIVATIAFGMGIDKSNVRFVIHHSVPKSLEGYYQETGRAGRDGGASSCYLYFSFSDVSKLRRMIMDSEDGSREQKERQMAMLRQMVQYCDNKADCRRVQVLRYFSEVFQKHDCNDGCDVCCSDASFNMQDVTEMAVNAIDIVRSFDGEQITLLKCVDAFRGAGSKHTKSTSDAAGSGKNLERGEAERLFYALIAEGALEEYQVMNKAKFPVQYIKLGPRARQVNHIELAMRLSPHGKSKAAPKRTKKVPRDAPDVPLSTNVSSPVQALSARRKKAATGSRLDKYRLDDFIAPDDEDDEDYEEASSDAFESMPLRKSRPHSAPITTDGVLDDLDQLHQALVEEFVGRAGQKVREIMSRDRLRGALFPDSILRQMAIRWTETPAEMKKIPGIVPEQVDHYGQQFCKLVKQSRRSYEEMTGGVDQDAGTAHNPNGNVIDLCTDDEDNDDDDEDEEDDEYGGFDDFDINEEDLVASSSRPISAEVAAFNDRFAESQSAANRIKPAAEPKGKGAWRNKKRGYRAVSGGSRGEGFSRGRKAPFGMAGKRAGGGVKKSTSRRSNDGAGRAKTSSRSGFISAMPT